MVAPVAPLVLPAALGMPWATYSVVHPKGYIGPCIRVQRASDNAQADVPYREGFVDKVWADTFAQGSQLKVMIFYDSTPGQTEPHNLIATSFASAPEFSNQDEYYGIRPVMLASFADSTPQEWFERTLTGDAQQIVLNNFSVYQVLAPTTSGNACMLFEFGNAGRTTPTAYLHYIGPGSIANPIAANIAGTNVIFTGAQTRAQLNTLCLSQSGTQALLRSNGVLTTIAATPSAVSAAKLTFGISAFGAQYNATTDMFITVIYPATHSSVQMQTVEAVVNACIPLPGPFTNRLVMAGTSLQRDIHCPNKQTECTAAGLNGDPTNPNNQFNPANLASWEVFNLGYPSHTMAQTYLTDNPNPLPYHVTLANAAYLHNVYVFCDPINDIIVQTFASAAAAVTFMQGLWTTVMLPAIAAFQANPAYDVIAIPTIVADGNFDTTTNFKESARLYWNEFVRANAVANGCVVYERANGPITNVPAVAKLGAPNYFADFLHWLLPVTQIVGNKLAAFLSELPTV